MLRKYVEHIQWTFPNITVDLLKLIFNLVLSQSSQAYKLRSSSPEITHILRGDFEQLGLVEFTQSDPDKFYVTKFMQSFLLSQLDTHEAKKFIIVETNMRVFAYTTNKLHKEILKLFLEPRIEFPDMLYGELTKQKAEEAFKN